MTTRPAVTHESPEDPAETARWEAEKRGVCANCFRPDTAHIVQPVAGRPCHVVSQSGQHLVLDWLLPEPPPTDTSWLRMESIRAAGRRQARRTSTSSITLTCFLAGLCGGIGGALLVWAVAHGLGAR